MSSYTGKEALSGEACKGKGQCFRGVVGGRLGGRGRNLLTATCTCSFAARPLPVRACFTSEGFNSKTSTSILLAATLMVPLTSPSWRAALGYLGSTKASSMTTRPGDHLVISWQTWRYIRPRRRGLESLGLVLIQPQSWA